MDTTVWSQNAFISRDCWNMSPLDASEIRGQGSNNGTAAPADLTGLAT